MHVMWLIFGICGDRALRRSGLHLQRCMYCFRDYTGNAIGQMVFDTNVFAPVFKVVEKLFTCENNKE